MSLACFSVFGLWLDLICGLLIACIIAGFILMHQCEYRLEQKSKEFGVKLNSFVGYRQIHPTVLDAGIQLMITC